MSCKVGPRVVDRVKRLPGIVDVTTDREQGGLQANITIDREAASRFGVRVQDIDNALNNAFSQRQILNNLRSSAINTGSFSKWTPRTSVIRPTSDQDLCAPGTATRRCPVGRDQISSAALRPWWSTTRANSRR